MKKKSVSILGAVLSLAVVFSSVGCRRQENNPLNSVDVGDKTVITVSNYGAGFGSLWLNKAKARFEEKYAETSFEPGKTGVYIQVENTLYSGMGWVQQIATRSEDMFFTEQVYYPDAVANKYFLDITDIVTENMSETQGENKTIESKLTSQQQTYYKQGGKYYGLPHYSGYFGIVYDMDLFEQRNLYFNFERTGLVRNKTEKRSVGLDGIEGTDDDGLPMTYDEMFMLCKAMRERGITPFIWTGKSREGYTGAFMNALYADYEGLENFMLNFDLKGKAEHLIDGVSVDSEGKITSVQNMHEETIDLSTGYKVYQQAGRAYAFSFMDRIVKGSYFADECIDGSFTNSEAQRAFLESRPYGENYIGMLIDGNFWDAEASAVFQDIEENFGSQWKKENRRFGFMPYPKATEEQIKDGSTLFDYLYSCAYINAKIPESRIKAAKTFLQFLYTDESLVEFTTTTNTPKALNYKLTEEQQNSLSKYGQTAWNVKKRSKIVYPFADNKVYLSSQSQFNMLLNWNSLVSGITHKNMIDALQKDQVGVPALFKGLSDYYTEERWKQLYGSNF